MNLSPAELAVFGTLGGTILGGLFTTLIALINKRSEEKRHFRELIFKSAVEEWKQNCTLSIEILKMNKGQKIGIEPLVTYLVHLLKLSEVLLDSKLTKENLSQKLTEVSEVMREVEKFTAPPKKENE